MKSKQNHYTNSEDDEEQESGQEQQDEQIYHSGSVTSDGGKHKIHCLTIIGQVEGHYTLPPQNKTTKYEHVIPQLVAIEQDRSIEGLLIILNTVGGDVEAGLAIAELVSGMKTPTVSLVLGGGHSIGVPLAVSATYSFIAPTATMTVHPVRMNGVMLGVPQTLSYFDKMQERITGFVSDNSRITPKRFKQLMMNSGELVMDIGTVLDGEQAVEEGLIDSLGTLGESIEKLYELIESSDNQKEPPETAPDKQPEKKSEKKLEKKAEKKPKPKQRTAAPKSKAKEPKQQKQETELNSTDPAPRRRGRPRNTESKEE